MYRALYRKWRPSDFDDVYGQPHITKTLKNELMTGRISHAYLFTGSRGTGKTTCAKILSKAVNCPNLKDGNPCNECEICKGIDNGSIMDVIEIDAASNNGVDNIRDLREETNFTPAVTKYRVYIIDEVHMLSIGAFNALLKTLEEPPSHVIFILATTEIHKLPSTILSRCQRFDFKRIPPQDIIARLKYVAEKENVTITDSAANLIANVADGGMRDALSLMDRCLSLTNDIDEAAVSDAAGIAGTVHLFRFSDYIASADFTNALKLVSELHSASCDIEIICTGLSEHFRNIMVAKTVRDCSGLIICPEAELENYRNEAAKFSVSKILQCLEILAQTSKTLKTASNKKIQLEAAVIKMCDIRDNVSSVISADNGLEGRITALEEKISSLLSGNIQSDVKKSFNPFIDDKKEISESGNDKVTDTPVVSAVQEEPDRTPDKEPAADTSSISDETPKQQPTEEVFEEYPDGPFAPWPDIIEKLMSRNLPLFGMMSQTSAEIKGGKILVYTDNPSLKQYLLDDKRFIDLYDSIIDVTGRKIRTAIVCTEDRKKEEASSGPVETMKKKIEEFYSNQGE